MLAGTAEAGDYTISEGTLTLAAGQQSVTATLTGVDDEVYEGEETVLITASVGGAAIGSLRLLIEDDEAAPVVALVLGSESIGEAGGVSGVTATAVPAAAEGFTVTVAAAAVAPGVAEDFTLSGSELTFAANATASTGEVTITAVDNGVDAADKSVVVTGTASRPEIAAPEAATLTIEDDEAAPVVTLELEPGSIGEAGGVSGVTATAAPAAAEGFTVTVAAEAVAPGVAEDFTLSGSELTFAANATASTGEVTITAVDNGVDAADKSVVVTGTASRPEIAAPEAVTLTIEDDDESSVTATLTVDVEEVDEGSGPVPIRVTAALDSSARTADTPVTVTVTGGGAGGAGRWMWTSRRYWR